jgi:hypothetical protein
MLSNNKQDEYIKKNWETKTDKEMGEYLGMASGTVRNRRKKMNLIKPLSFYNPQAPIKAKNTEEEIELYNERRHKNKQKRDENKQIDLLLDEKEKLQKELEASYKIKQGIDPYTFDYKVSDNKGESIAVVVASDWHIEETVKPETINGLNKYNLSIAENRAEQFFQNALKMVQKEQNESRIDTLVLALLGDFITGNIHEEFLETCSLRPMEAIIMAENLMIGGIDYLLKNSELKLIIPCVVGNHTRITKQTHIGTEQGNSLETFMYHHLQNYYKGNKRVEFLIAEGYLSYLTLWNFTLCFHHGHALKYSGGMGGLTIPINKAVAQWEKLRHADLYVSGHWHTFFDGGNFLVNGSLIGYNPFAVFIKANFERPKQAFFLINRKYNCKTVVIPIMFNI